MNTHPGGRQVIHSLDNKGASCPIGTVRVEINPYSHTAMKTWVLACIDEGPGKTLSNVPWVTSEDRAPPRLSMLLLLLYQPISNR